MRLRPDHWRYRFADKHYRNLRWLSVLGPLAAIGAVVTQSVWVFAIGFVLIAPFALVLANLGCWNCFYNLLRPYGGPASIEHGDSWTTQPLPPWRSVTDFPHNCPKCGAVILSSSISAKAAA